mmetsp:Transcript_8464/g.24389  ORF Transcript_8464/g.24389 Transcript_8464/m.24389 type:complete len:234 (+) Transcript_8464:330-1031(+)
MRADKYARKEDEKCHESHQRRKQIPLQTQVSRFRILQQRHPVKLDHYASIQQCLVVVSSEDISQFQSCRVRNKERRDPVNIIVASHPNQEVVDVVVVHDHVFDETGQLEGFHSFLQKCALAALDEQCDWHLIRRLRDIRRFDCSSIYVQTIISVIFLAHERSLFQELQPGPHDHVLRPWLPEQSRQARKGLVVFRNCHIALRQRDSVGKNKNNAENNRGRSSAGRRHRVGSST